MEDTSKEVVEETVQTPEATIEEPSTPQEEPQVEEPETPRTYAGKYKSAEDLEKAYEEAQKLISQQGAKIKEFEAPALPQEKQAILDELKSLGVVTQADLQKQNAVLTQKQKDDAEIKSLGLNPAQESLLREYASSKNNLTKSMTECWNEITGATGGTVVKRTTTIKPKKGSVESFKPMNPRDIARLSKEDEAKYWRDYAAYKAEQ